MEYLEHRIIFSPEIKIFIKFYTQKKLWIIEIPAFQDVYIEKPSLNEAFEALNSILTGKMDFIINIEKKDFIKNVRKSDIVIEYSGKFYLCIYKFDTYYKGLTIKVNSDNKPVLSNNIIIDTNSIDELIVLLTKIKSMPSSDSGFEGFISHLKLKIGINNSTICWWSGATENWVGLTEVIKKLEEIYKTIFLDIIEK